MSFLYRTFMGTSWLLHPRLLYWEHKGDQTMNKILKIVLIVLGVLLVTGGLLFAGAMLGSRFNQRAFVDNGLGFGIGRMGIGANMPRVRMGGRGHNQG